MHRSVLFGMSMFAIAGIAHVPQSLAGADPVDSATCFVAGQETALPPGIGLEPSQQQIRNRGLSITCSGRLDGQELDPNRAGVFDADVTTGTRPGFGGTGTCITDGGVGHVSVRLPTVDNGMLPLDGPAEYVTLGPVNYLEGDLGPYHFVSYSLSGPDLTKLDGNCFTSPLLHWVSAGPLMLSGNAP
ncbi:hypothetical protein ACWIGI_22050 [Nocardia sp. NPDC055321]